MKTSANQEKLVSFLYILLRDELSAGKVEAIVQHHVEADVKALGYNPDVPADYTNKFLEGYARALADRLTD